MFDLLIAALGALAALYLKEFFARMSLQRSMALAVRAEVQAVLSIVETRGYLTYLKGEVARGHLGAKMDLRPVRISRDYFPVSGKAGEKVGALPNHIATEVFSYYVWANSFIEDATRENTIQSGGKVVLSAEQVEQQWADVAWVDETRQVLEQAIRHGEEVIRLVNEDFPTSGPFRAHCAAFVRRVRREFAMS